MKHQKEELVDKLKLESIYKQRDQFENQRECHNSSNNDYYEYQENEEREEARPAAKPKISKWAQYLNQQDYESYIKQTN